MFFAHFIVFFHSPDQSSEQIREAARTFVHLLFWLKQNVERRVGDGSERQPGGAQRVDGLKAGVEAQASRAAPEESQHFQSLFFFLFNLVLFFLPSSSRINFTRFYFFSCIFSVFFFSPGFLLLLSPFSFLLDGDGEQMFRPARRMTYSDEVGV